MIKIVLTLILAFSLHQKTTSLAAPLDPNCWAVESVNDELVCTKCVFGYYLEGQSCIYCPTVFKGCNECTSSACSMCNYGYDLDSAGFCTDKWCAYSMDDACIQCRKGYSYDNDKGKCSVGYCPQTNCEICGKDGCDICQDTYGPSKRGGDCQSSKCSIFHSACTKCSKTQGCFSCKAGFTLNGPQECLDCVGITKQIGCVECNKTSCLQCKDGFELKNDDVAKPTCVMKNCEIYDGQDCRICKNKFYYQDLKCLSGRCSDYGSCVRCGNKGCYECETGHTPKKGLCVAGSCTDVYPNCLSCNADGCTTCEQEYYIDHYGNCIAQPTSSYFYVLIVGIAIILFVVYQCWKMEKKQYWYTEDRGEETIPRFRIHYKDKTYQDSEFYRLD